MPMTRKLQVYQGRHPRFLHSPLQRSWKRSRALSRQSIRCGHPAREMVRLTALVLRTSCRVAGKCYGASIAYRGDCHSYYNPSSSSADEVRTDRYEACRHAPNDKTNGNASSATIVCDELGKDALALALNTLEYSTVSCPSNVGQPARGLNRSLRS